MEPAPNILCLAAVTGSAGTERLPDCAARLLAQAGQGAELAQNTDHRLAAAIAGGKGGFNASHPRVTAKPSFPAAGRVPLPTDAR